MISFLKLQNEVITVIERRKNSLKRLPAFNLVFIKNEGSILSGSFNSSSDYDSKN